MNIQVGTKRSMAVEKKSLSMNEEDWDLLDRGRSQYGMPRSMYVRLLLAEHENKTPSFIQYKEVIQVMSELNNSIKVLVLKDTISDAGKLQIIEHMEEIKKLIKEKL